MKVNTSIQRDEYGELPPVDVAVIGAGMAGLSAAVYARLSGLSVRVFERHSIPGGLCTSWKRSGYVFDYCIEYLVGSSRGLDFYYMWKDLGVTDNIKFHHISSFGQYVGTDGQTFNLYTDYRKLYEHMLEIAPEDKKKIREFCRAIRKARHLQMTELDTSFRGLSRLVRSLPALPMISKLSGSSLLEWCSELKNPFLREALPTLIGWADFPLAGPITAFAKMNEDSVAYPLGGSLPLARAVEDKAKSLGAEFVYGSGARRVIVENGRALGLELDDGSIQKARYVIAACDARAAFDKLLQGRVKDRHYEAMFKRRNIYPSMVQVSLGVKIDPKWNVRKLPSKINLPLTKPFVIDGRKRTRIRIYLYSHDPSMAPEDRTVILVKYVGDYDHWKALRANRKEYKAEKARILAEVVSALDVQFPGISSRIEAKDVATPISAERYTGSWRGSSQGWVLTTDLMKKLIAGKRLPKTFAGVDGFHLIGQWTEPGGGLPPTARTGRDVIRAIMRSEGRRAAR